MSNALPPRAAADAGWASHAKEVHDILAQVTFPGYTFEVGGTDRTWIRAHFNGPCTVTGTVERQSTRRWYVSEQACRNEVVQTALKCVLTSVEHEARERFKYRGKAIYGPHFDVDALHRICTDKELDYRGMAKPLVQRCDLCGYQGTLTDHIGQCPQCHWDELRPVDAPGVDIDAVHRRFAPPPAPQATCHRADDVRTTTAKREERHVCGARGVRA